MSYSTLGKRPGSPDRPGVTSVEIKRPRGSDYQPQLSDAPQYAQVPTQAYIPQGVQGYVPRGPQCYAPQPFYHQPPPPVPQLQVADPNALPKGRRLGVCTQWDKEKAYGFIRDHAAGKDARKVFCHNSSLVWSIEDGSKNWASLAAGDQVEFEYGRGERGVEALKVSAVAQFSTRRRGTVAVFHADRGFGFVTDDVPSEVDNKQVLVHHNQIKSGSGFKVLTPGEIIEYGLIKGPKGFSCVDVVQTNPPASLQQPPQNGAYASTSAPQQPLGYSQAAAAYAYPTQSGQPQVAPATAAVTPEAYYAAYMAYAQAAYAAAQKAAAPVVDVSQAQYPAQQQQPYPQYAPQPEQPQQPQYSPPPPPQQLQYSLPPPQQSQYPHLQQQQDQHPPPAPQYAAPQLPTYASPAPYAPPPAHSPSYSSYPPPAIPPVRPRSPPRPAQPFRGPPPPQQRQQPLQQHQAPPHVEPGYGNGLPPQQQQQHYPQQQPRPPRQDQRQPNFPPGPSSSRPPLPRQSLSLAVGGTPGPSRDGAQEERPVDDAPRRVPSAWGEPPKGVEEVRRPPRLTNADRKPPAPSNGDLKTPAPSNAVWGAAATPSAPSNANWGRVAERNARRPQGNFNANGASISSAPPFSPRHAAGPPFPPSHPNGWPSQPPSSFGQGSFGGANFGPREGGGGGMDLLGGIRGGVGEPPWAQGPQGSGGGTVFQGNVRGGAGEGPFAQGF